MSGPSPNVQIDVSEPRWPWLVAMFAFMASTVALRLWLPNNVAIEVPWLVPVLEVFLIVALLAGNPGGSAEHPRMRRAQIVLASLLVVAAIGATTTLIYDLITGESVATHADQLLATGAVIWSGNILAFSLLFWLTDGGGPVARAQHRTAADFAFVQHTNPEVGPADWRPVFLDYLHLAFTNATAFSPTDVMPLTHRAKYTMILQSMLSLVLVALIIARSVNAFT